jgi:hypothetical protein
VSLVFGNEVGNECGMELRECFLKKEKKCMIIWKLDRVDEGESRNERKKKTEGGLFVQVKDDM